MNGGPRSNTWAAALDTAGLGPNFISDRIQS